MKLKILIFLVLIFQFATSQTPYRDAATIDASMTTDRQKCIDHEATISKMHSNLSTTVQSVIDKLEAEFLSRDLCTALKNLKSLLQMQMTINSFVTYVNISTCGDINNKITMIELDQQKIGRIRTRASNNITALYARYGQIARFSGEVVTTSHYSSVTAVMSSTISVVTELSKYSGITLALSISNCIINSNLLNVFKRTYCTCLKTAAMSGYNSTLEANVNVVESALTKTQASIKNFTNTALTLCKAAYTSVTSEFFKSNLDFSLLNLILSWSNCWEPCYIHSQSYKHFDHPRNRF
jgi:hypothetical protein